MFVIRETESGAFCVSQRERTFSMNMQNAAQFVSRTNAEKAIKTMFQGDKCGQQYNSWSIDEKLYHPDVQAYIEQCVNPNNPWIQDIRDSYTQKTCVMEVVEVKLTLA